VIPAESLGAERHRLTAREQPAENRAVRLRVSGVLLRFTDYRSVIEVDAGTVEAALVRLAEENATFKRVLLDRAGRVRATHKIFLNGELLAADQLSHPAGPSDRVDLITAISGG
jgi:hypothetical protein